MRLLLPIVLLLALTSCGDQEAVKKITAFSTATDTVIQNTNSAFDLVERSYEDAEIARAAANFDNGFSVDSVKKFFPAKDLAARKLVLVALKEYAANLAAIMSDDKLKEFDTSTQALGNSLKTLDAAFVSQNILNHGVVSEKDVNLFSAAANALGRWFLQSRREKVVRENVRTMQESVRNISALLVKDFGDGPVVTKESRTAGKRRVLGLRAQLWNNYSDLIFTQGEFIEHNKSRLSPIEKREEIKKLLSLISDRQTSDDTVKAVAAALQQLATTHDQLVKAFDKKDLSLVQSISDLIAEGERIKTFYEALGKKS